MERTQILPPDPGRLIEGLRDTGYDFNTALADIVDNSVDAGATDVRVRMQMDVTGEVIISVADNGCGMSEPELLRAMTYGAPSRPVPGRLGKFGLGLKTASTAFCRRLSVISRGAESTTAVKATWDLDHVADRGEWEIILSEPSTEELGLLDEAAGGETGTLVLWEHVDRLLKNYANPAGTAARKALSRRAEEFVHHAAMVYQRFLDDGDSRARNLSMTVNDGEVQPWNPFCPTTPGSDLVAEQVVPVEFDEMESSFTLKAYVLPRREDFPSAEEASKAMLGNEAQGIYVYRENRLIPPSTWLGMFSKEPHMSLLRVEFSFDHSLDMAFHIDIKKSRILLQDELYNHISERFIPAPRRAAAERYRKGIRRPPEPGSPGAGAHKGSNVNIGKHERDVTTSTVETVPGHPGQVDVTNPRGRFRIRMPVVETSPDGLVNVQAVDSIDDGLLWEPALIEGHHAVRINRGHPYYHKVYRPNFTSGVTVQGMDSLLWALAEAELGCTSDSVASHFSDLKFEVSRILRKLVEDLPEPADESDADEQDNS